MIREMNKQDIGTKEQRFLIIIIFLPCLFAIKGLNSDIWFLLNSGRYVMENGLPYIEPFTIHQGLKFVMQQWLSACVFWTAYSNMGIIGLYALVLIFDLLTVFFFFKLCMKVSNNYFFISFAVSLFFSICIQFFMTQRPSIFSILIFVLEVYVLESHLKNNRKRYLLFLPILSLLLINLHAAMWPVLFVIILPYIVDSLHIHIKKFHNLGYPKKYLALTILLMVAAGFLNPYGTGAMTYLFKSYGYEEISALVLEMRPISINLLIGALIYANIFIVISLYIFYKKGSTKIRYVLLTVGTIVMVLSAVRNYSFFVICGFFPLAYYFKDIKLHAARETTKRVLLMRKVLIGLLIFALVFPIYMILNSNEESIAKDNYLKDTIQFLLKSEDKNNIRLYTGYNDGGMAEFEGLCPYIDARAEVFVKKNNGKEDIMREYYLLQKGQLYYKDFLKKYQFTNLILTTDDILYTYLRYDNDYVVTYTNEKYSLFVDRL